MTHSWRRFVGRGATGFGLSALLGMALLSAASTLASCRQDVVAVQQPKSCELQIVSLSVIAAPAINPTVEGEPRPVQLRIYQLATDTRLQNATFEEIWKADKATLADDLLKVDELSVFPASRTEVKFERDPAAQNVVGVALFRNPKGKSWFTSFELPPAPGKGMCGVTCTGPECDAGPILDPHYSLFIEGTKVDVGDEHLDDVPEAGRVQVVRLSKKGGGGAAAPAGSN